jgi:hypothetical protein
MLCGVAVAGAATANGQAPAPLDSNRKDTSVIITPGARYEAGAFKRALFGSGWRDLWTTPVAVPVLDIETYAGGLELAKRGGGAQSLVLHLKEKNGWRDYRFRSVDKYPLQSMAPELKGTLVGRMFQDRVSTLLPGAPIIVHPLLDAVGVLHVPADLYVMGDSPRLEIVRDTVSGMLGTFELKGEEAPDDKPGFAGSRAIKGVEKFHEDLASGRGHRLDEREFLAARLVDFLINDPDRSLDNYDWARFGEKGAYVWRPVPRDRDQAFIDARGLMNALVFRPLLPTLMTFGPRYELQGLTYSTYVHDRRLLQRLTADDFRAVALRVRSAITDSVITRVIAELPAEWRERTTADERLWSVLRARRDAVPDVAEAFYETLSGEIDVYGTEDADRIEVLRHSDGRVTVTITDPKPAPIVAGRRNTGRAVTTSDGTVIGANEEELGPYFSRTFKPGETKEVRLYAGGGDDIAVITGASSDVIKVRLIGGKGDDLLADSAAGGGSILYDAEGTNRFGAPRGTRVSTRPWKPLAPEMGMRMGSDWAPDWGGSKGWRPSLDYSQGAGVILGVGPAFRSYGFRRLPYHWDVSSQLLVGTSNRRLGISMDADYRVENSPRAFQLSATATQLETTRFFGYGNDTPRASRRASLVNQTMLAVEPSVVWYLGWRKREGAGNAFRGEDTLRTGVRPATGEFRVGPTITWIDPDPEPGSPLALSAVDGGRSFGVAGAALGLELDRTDDDAVPTAGYKIEAGVAAFPIRTGDGGEAFGTARGRGSVYIPLKRVGAGPHLAFRLGAARAIGGYPAQYAATIGGRSSVRGYSHQRFAGDVATDGSAELRVPVGTVNLFIRSRVGVFALADAGRVWFDGRSDGGWHTGVGGGIWFAAFGRSVSVAYARGEGGRFYVKGGPFF